MGSLIRTQLSYHILFPNIIGSMILGFLTALPINHKQKILLSFGFCGALTTFSGWIFTAFRLLKIGLVFQSTMLILSGLSFSILAALLGLLLGKIITKKLI